MRFISIFTHEPIARPPTQEEMAAMGPLVAEAMKEGWLIATEGVCFGENGMRIRKDAAGISVIDGPFAEAKEVLGGYALLQADSKEQVLQYVRRFLDVAGQGSCEIYQLYEMS